MNKAKNKKKLKKSQGAASPFSGLRENWRQKLPVLFFVLGFAVLMILFYIFWLSEFSQSVFQPKVVGINAMLSSRILNIFGMQTTASEAMLTSKQFSVSIARGCDAIEAMALFVAALLSFPAKWKSKAIGFFAGIALLFILNLGRIISLFLTGVYFPKAFEIMHVEVWQVLFILFAIAIWIFWIKWTRKGVPRAS